MTENLPLVVGFKYMKESYTIDAINYKSYLYYMNFLFGVEKGPVFGAVWEDYGMICDGFHISSKYRYEKKSLM